MLPVGPLADLELTSRGKTGSPWKNEKRGQILNCAVEKRDRESFLDQDRLLMRPWFSWLVASLSGREIPHAGSTIGAAHEPFDSLVRERRVSVPLPSDSSSNSLRVRQRPCTGRSKTLAVQEVSAPAPAVGPTREFGPGR